MKKIIFTLLLFFPFLLNANASQPANVPTDESGIKMFGFCLSSTDGLDIQRGPFFFDSSDPTSMTNIDTEDELYLLSGEYFNGNWYVLTYVTDGWYLYPEALITLDMETGEHTHIANIPDDVIIWDMSYNYVDKTMYGIANEDYGNVTYLHTIDLTTAAITEIAPILGGSQLYVAFACNRAGDMYAVGNDGNLYQLAINRADDPEESDEVNASYIGALGLSEQNLPVYYQSMTFDQATDILYWASGGKADYFEFHTIDLLTGEANHIGHLGPDDDRGVQVSNLVTAYTDLNPKAHSGFSLASARPGDDGELSVNLVFQPNNSTVDGEEYDSPFNPIGTLHIYKDDFSADPVHVKENLIASFSSWKDEDVSAGWHMYKLVVIDENNGPGVPRYLRTFVGPDTPTSVTNIELTYNEESNMLQLSWDAPAIGVNGGWIDPAGLSYTLVRYPGGVEVATQYTDTYFEEEAGIEAGYYYTITVFSITGGEATTTSEVLIAGQAYTVPWLEDFDTADADKSWERGSNDRPAWNRQIVMGLMSTPGMEFFLTSDEYNRMFSPRVALEAGKTYRLSWYDKASSSPSYTVTLGKTKTPEAHTTVLKNIESVAKYFEEKETWFTVPESENYSIGWSCEDVFSFLYIDHILLEEAFEIDLAIAYLQGTPVPAKGMENPYLVTVKNNGLTNVSGFKVGLVNESGTELVSQTYTGTLEPGESDVVEVLWTPTEEKKMKIKAMVEATGDGRSANNQSKEMTIDVQPTDVEIVTIGTGETTSFLMPFNFMGGNSCTQSLYFEDEIGKTGTINAIEYTNDFEASYLYNREVKVYISIVEVDKMTGWIIPDEDTELYFDGLIDFPKGKNTITILLDKPFNYNGGTVLITTQHLQPESNSFSDIFVVSNMADTKPNRTYTTMSNAPFTWNTSGSASSNMPNIQLTIITEGSNIVPVSTGMVAYPNPTRGEVNLKNYSSSDGVVKVYDLTGKCVYETNKDKFSIAHLSRGIYLLKVAGETFKIIKE